MIGIVASLLGSRIGRWAAIAIVVAAAAYFAYMSAYRKGADAERAKKNAANMAILADRISIDEEIRSMSRDDRRKELEKWVR